jgi:hypothetical protein
MAVVTLATAAPPFSPMVSSGRQLGFALEELSICSAENLSSDGEGEPSRSSATSPRYGKLPPEMAGATDSGFPWKSHHDRVYEPYGFQNYSSPGKRGIPRRESEFETLHVPVLLGDGARLFDNLGNAEVQLEQVRAVEAPGVTHLKYRVPT